MEEEEIAELMALGINHPARKRYREREKRKKNEKLEKGWNATPMRSVPANLRGIKPSTNEPWAIDLKYYQQKTGDFEDVMNDNAPYDDRSVLSASKGYVQQVTASGLDGPGKPAWNSSVLRPVPHTLKGIKPQTREPWAVDMAINRNADLEGFDTFSAQVVALPKNVELEPKPIPQPRVRTARTPPQHPASTEPRARIQPQVENDSVAGDFERRGGWGW